MGPYIATREGYRFILVVTDLFTRWVEAFPLMEAKGTNITQLLDEEVFSRFGHPRTILTDNGSQFTGGTFIRACERWRATPRTTSIYHPQGNPTERRNQELKKLLRIHLTGKRPEEWARYLPQALFAIRRRQNAATQQSPSHLLLGYDLTRPGEWDDETEDRVPAEERRESARQKQDRYQRRYAPRKVWPPSTYQVGQRVYVRNFQGRPGHIPTPWIGPYPILRRTGDTTYAVETEGRDLKYHEDNIRPAQQDLPLDQEPLPGPEVQRGG